MASILRSQFYLAQPLFTLYGFNDFSFEFLTLNQFSLVLLSVFPNLLTHYSEFRHGTSDRIFEKKSVVDFWYSGWFWGNGKFSRAGVVCRSLEMRFVSLG